MTKKWTDSMCWVEGLRVNARGDECWAPLYCARRPIQSKAILLKLLKEPKGHEEFDDFRVVRPEEQATFAEKSAAVARYRNGVLLLPTCPGCASTECSKIKRGEERLWKCLQCSRRWAREGPLQPLRRTSRAKTARVEAISAALHKPVEASERPQEARKPSRRGKSRTVRA